MDNKRAEAQFTIALTRASLEKIPPELCVATGHDDEVMLFLLRVDNAKATTQVLMDAITLSETDSILTTLSATGGLIRKRFHIDDAHRLKDRLEAVGSLVEFIRPDD